MWLNTAGQPRRGSERAGGRTAAMDPARQQAYVLFQSTCGYPAVAERGRRFSARICHQGALLSDYQNGAMATCMIAAPSQRDICHTRLHRHHPGMFRHAAAPMQHRIKAEWSVSVGPNLVADPAERSRCILVYDGRVGAPAGTVEGADGGGQHTGRRLWIMRATSTRPPWLVWRGLPDCAPPRRPRCSRMRTEPRRTGPFRGSQAAAKHRATRATSIGGRNRSGF